MKEVQDKINAYIAQEGITMEKKISAAMSTLFYYRPAVYDRRIARSWEEVCELYNEGFFMDGDTDYGIFLLNALMNGSPLI